jgi:hypothetical protein
MTEQIVTFTIESTPSRSKGWARFTARVNGASVLATKSGTEYGSGREGDTRVTVPLAAGAVITLQCQVALMVGTGHRRRQERYSETYRLVVGEGETADVEYRPGSQGLRLSVSGARLEVAGDRAPRSSTASDLALAYCEGNERALGCGPDEC